MISQATQDYVHRLEELSGCRISAIGGALRAQIISVHSLLGGISPFLPDPSSQPDISAAENPRI